jgi:hypothetical protein
MVTGAHPGGPAAPPPEARDELLDKLDLYLRRLDALSRWTGLVVAVAGVLIVAALVIAFAPAFLQVAAYDPQAPLKVKFDERWRNIFLGVAVALAFLLAMYLAASYRARLLAQQVAFFRAAPSAGRAGDASRPETAASDAFTIHSPPGFVEDLDKFLEYGDAGWGQRGLYVGLDGARSWIHVSQHPDYDIAEDKLRPKLQDVLADVEALGSVISLGPGDGRVDVMLMSGLVASRGPGTSYVPIDISEGLLLATMKRFRKKHRDIRMPFGILGDFEYGWDHFRNLLAGEQHPRLYSILGNTVANVDSGLERFFPDFWAGVAPGDYVLFDVLLGNFDELLRSDRSGRFDPNLLFPQEEVMRRYKKFIGYGARRVASDHRVFDEEADQLTERLAVNRRKDVEGGYDQLRLEYHADLEDSRTIFTWRRYGSNTTPLEKLLRENLQGCRVIDKADVTDDGKTTRLILLRREAA